MNQIVLVLIVANVLFSLKGFDDGSFFNKYKFQVGAIKSGEKLRMITSGFLHADWMHLGFNMYTLYIFSGIVVSGFGNILFLLIYLASLLTGSVYSFVQNKEDNYYSAIGASGAVSGIVFSSILLYPEMTLRMFPIPIELPAYVFGIGYLLYSIYGMKNKLGNIGHSAHLGGAMGGYALTLFLMPSVITSHTVIVVVMGVIIGGLLLFGDKLDFNA